MCTMLCTYIFHEQLGPSCICTQLDFHILVQDYQIQEGGSQDFLIQDLVQTLSTHICRVEICTTR